MDLQSARISSILTGGPGRERRPGLSMTMLVDGTVAKRIPSRISQKSSGRLRVLNACPSNLAPSQPSPAAAVDASSATRCPLAATRVVTPADAAGTSRAPSETPMQPHQLEVVPRALADAPVAQLEDRRFSGAGMAQAAIVGGALCAISGGAGAGVRAAAAFSLKSLPRVGTALTKTDLAHAGLGSKLLQSQVAWRGSVRFGRGGDGRWNTYVRMQGAINGRSGQYQWFMRRGAVHHQHFRPD